LTSTHPIADQQESVAAVRLLKAVAVAHLRNQRAQTLSLGVSIALAVAGLLTGSGSQYGTAVTLGGTLCAALYMAVMAPWAERYLRIGAPRRICSSNSMTRPASAPRRTRTT
jgi:hypothetical protein